jgi:hypothetical protein
MFDRRQLSEAADAGVTGAGLLTLIASLLAAAAEEWVAGAMATLRLNGRVAIL